MGIYTGGPSDKSPHAQRAFVPPIPPQQQHTAMEVALPAVIISTQYEHHSNPPPAPHAATAVRPKANVLISITASDAWLSGGDLHVSVSGAHVVYAC